jgi:hypothetical protein
MPLADCEIINLNHINTRSCCIHLVEDFILLFSFCSFDCYFADPFFQILSMILLGHSLVIVTPVQWRFVGLRRRLCISIKLGIACASWIVIVILLPAGCWLPSWRPPQSLANCVRLLSTSFASFRSRLRFVSLHCFCINVILSFHAILRFISLHGMSYWMLEKIDKK